MMKDLEIAFMAKEITAFGGVSLLYKMLTMNQRQAFLGLWRTTENFDL